MLEYDEIDVSEGIDCDICHYWYFLDKGLKFEPYLCSGCRNLMQNAMNFNDVAIVSVRRNDYRIHFRYMGKDDAINIMEMSDVNEKSELLESFLS